MTPVELLQRFVCPLNQLDIPHMTAAAVAHVVYGEPRLSLDLDIVLLLAPGKVQALATRSLQWVRTGDSISLGSFLPRDGEARRCSRGRVRSRRDRERRNKR